MIMKRTALAGYDPKKGYEMLMDLCKGIKPVPTVICHPCSEASLQGAIEAAEFGLIAPILVGPKSKMEQVAKACDIDLSPYDIIDTHHSHESAKKTVELVRAGQAEAIMKGSLHTDELLGEVIKKDTGLRTERRISHVFLMSVDGYHRPFVVTDAAVNIYPDLMTKRDICQNAIDFAQVMRHYYKASKDSPIKVAILSAVETVNPNMKSTLDAAALCKMADRGQITGALLDGPLAYDNAMNLEAAKVKGILSPVAGDASVLLVPDLESGNILAKQLIYTSGAYAVGMIVGARVPIILTSRADGVESRIGSCAVASMMADYQRNHGNHEKGIYAADLA
jgi:phosphate acetyltransferase/phosphate butyryltransferase